MNFYGNNQEKLFQNFHNDDFSIKKFEEVSLLKTTNNFLEITDSLNLIQVQISMIGIIDRQKLESGLGGGLQTSGSTRYLTQNQANNNLKSSPAPSGLGVGGDKKYNYRQSPMMDGDGRGKHHSVINNENKEDYLNLNVNGNLKGNVVSGSSYKNKVGDFNSYRSNHNTNFVSLKNTPDFKNYTFTLNTQQKII